mgnify:CR=1 FL=1
MLVGILFHYIQRQKELHVCKQSEHDFDVSTQALLYCMSGLFFPVAFAVCDEPLPQKTCFAKQGSRTKFVGYFLIECRNGQLGIIYLYVKIQ